MKRDHYKSPNVLFKLKTDFYRNCVTCYRLYIYIKITIIFPLNLLRFPLDKIVFFWISMIIMITMITMILGKGNRLKILTHCHCAFTATVCLVHSSELHAVCGMYTHTQMLPQQASLSDLVLSPPHCEMNGKHRVWVSVLCVAPHTPPPPPQLSVLQRAD